MSYWLTRRCNTETQRPTLSPSLAIICALLSGCGGASSTGDTSSASTETSVKSVVPVRPPAPILPVPISPSPTVSSLNFLKGPTESLSPSVTTEAVAADWDGDGVTDIATSVPPTVGANNGGIYALRTLSTTSPPHIGFTFACESRPVGAGIVTGDFNGDGKTDIAISCSDWYGYVVPNVEVFLNTSSVGQTAFSVVPAISQSNLGTILGTAVGDFNSDGRADLAIMTDSTVNVFLGDGAGHFGQASWSLPVNDPWQIAVGDFNKDGHADIAVIASNYQGPHGSGCVTSPVSGAKDSSGNAAVASLAIFLGNGNGSFTGSAVGNWVGSGVHAQAMAVADVNKDGIADVIVGNTADNAAYVLLGKGTGSFGAASTISTSGVGAIGNACNRVTVADMNGDGNADVVLSGSPVTLLVGNGQGAFTAKSIAGMTGPAYVGAFAYNGLAQPPGIAILNADSNGFVSSINYWQQQ